MQKSWLYLIAIENGKLTFNANRLSGYGRWKTELSVV